jgi:uncharacterized protein
MKAVFDTNIFLAAFFNHGFVFELLNRVVHAPGAITLYTSPDLQIELKEKVVKYQKKGLISKQASADALDFFSFHTTVVFPREKIVVVKRDPADNKVLECAVKAGADIIVTLDQDLIKLKTFRSIAIIHPKTFYFMLPLEL